MESTLEFEVSDWIKYYLQLKIFKKCNKIKIQIIKKNQLYKIEFCKWQYIFMRSLGMIFGNLKFIKKYRKKFEKNESKKLWNWFIIVNLELQKTYFKWKHLLHFTVNTKKKYNWI